MELSRKKIFEQRVWIEVELPGIQVSMQRVYMKIELSWFKISGQRVRKKSQLSENYNQARVKHDFKYPHTQQIRSLYFVYNGANPQRLISIYLLFKFKR